MTAPRITRRSMMMAGAASLASAPWSGAADAATSGEGISADEAPTFLAHAHHVFAAIEKAGEPISPEALAQITRLESAGDVAGAAGAAQDLLDTRTLLNAEINPEARVTVSQAHAQPELFQSGWRLFLVRLNNPTLVPGKLDLTSPQALPANNRYPAGHVHMAHIAGLGAPEGLPKVTQGDIAGRWVDLDIFDQPPLPAALAPLPISYHIIALYARDAGRRSARLALNIGPGTQDIGTRGEVEVIFAARPAQSVMLGLKDVDGAPVTCSLLVRDRQGRVYPAQTKRQLPDLYFQPKVYRGDGESLTLAPGEYDVELGRGPEYWLETTKRSVMPSGMSHWSFKLQRWVDPREHGYYSGDHHIHAAGCAHYDSPEEGVSPAVMLPQIEGEAINIGAVLTWAPGFYAQKRNFSGHDDPVSQPENRLHYDLEVSGFPSSHCGHLVMLGMKAMDYPGTTKIEEWPSSNAPVLEWGRAQSAITGYAHSGFGLWADTTDLPNYAMPPFDGIGANDYIVTVTAGLVDFISAVSTPPAAELNIWYHTLNAGFRTRIGGETDWPCIYDANVGMGRTYVKLAGPLSYEGWCEGMKAGRSYVSEGRAHLMNFRGSSGGALAEPGGADLILSSPASISFEVLVAARLEPEPTQATEVIRKLGAFDKPYWHLERARIGDTRKVLVELVINGLAVESQTVDADGAEHIVRFTYTPTHSCWAAIRIMHGAHTNPLWISLDGAPVRIKRSIEWCRAAVDQCWSQKVLRIRAAEIAAEAARYGKARLLYDARLREAEA